MDPTADTTIEANETVALTLATGTGYTIGTTAAVVGTITNDDFPSITLAVSPASVTEDGTANLIYTFSRTGPTTSALTVNYTVAGTATLGTDFTGISATGTTKTVTFAAGSATATLTVDPTADTTIEANETVALTLATGTGYTIGTTTAVTGTITNDDVDTTLISTVSVTSLASPYVNLTLAGTSAINGTANAAANVIIGNDAVNTLSGLAGNDRLIGNGGNDLLIGGAAADTMTGGSGSDTFLIALADSRLSAFDRITDFAIGSDSIDGPTAVTAANLRELGAVSNLTETGIQAVLTSGTFALNGAATFSYNDPSQGTRTFLALNDGTAGFNANNDSIVEIKGFSGALTSLSII